MNQENEEERKSKPKKTQKLHATNTNKMRKGPFVKRCLANALQAIEQNENDRKKTRQEINKESKEA